MAVWGRMWAYRQGRYSGTLVYTYISIYLYIPILYLYSIYLSIPELHTIIITSADIDILAEEHTEEHLYR